MFNLYNARASHFTRQYSDTVFNLAAIDVLEFNRKELNRILENESHQKRVPSYRQPER